MCWSCTYRPETDQRQVGTTQLKRTVLWTFLLIRWERSMRHRLPFLGLGEPLRDYGSRVNFPFSIPFSHRAVSIREFLK
jgi:hypothetical protein